MEIKSLVFITRNEYKIAEVKMLLKDSGLQLVHHSDAIEELQTEDDDKLVRDKLLKAFRMCGRPVLVEHTSLHIRYLNNFPGGLTQIFWEKLGADRLSEVVGNLPDTTVIAKTIIGYCDGKNLHYFDGEISGKVPSEPAGPRGFQWDCVFIPYGYTQTFAEMGTEKKNEISMRKIAYQKFIKYLQS
jgi:XTP/dITP diphosphohydrolase